MIRKAVTLPHEYQAKFFMETPRSVTPFLKLQTKLETYFWLWNDALPKVLDESSTKRRKVQQKDVKFSLKVSIQLWSEKRDTMNVSRHSQEKKELF